MALVPEPVNPQPTPTPIKKTTTTKITPVFSNLASSDHAASVVIDGTTLRPAPFVTINVEKYFSGDLVIGGKWVVNLTGTIYGENFTATLANIREFIDNISESSDCLDINIECNGNVLINGQGKIVSANVDQGEQATWVNAAPYSITLDVYTNEGDVVVRPSDKLSSYNLSNCLINNLTENFTLAFNEEASKGDLILGSSIHGTRAHLRYNFDITVGGMVICIGESSLLGGVEAAEQVLLARLNELKLGNFPSELGNPALVSEIDIHTNNGAYINLRTVDVNPIQGTISVRGEAIYRPSNCSHPDALISTSVDGTLDSTDPRVRNFTISGSIEGLHTHDFQGIIDHSEYHSATSTRVAAADTAYQAIYSAATNIAAAHDDITPGAVTCRSTLGNECGEATDTVCEQYYILSAQRTKNYHDGTVNFSIVCSNKRQCNMPGFIYYNVDIAEDYGHEQIVTHNVVGRGYPLIQNINCYTAHIKTITVSGKLDSCGANDQAALQSCVETACDQYIESGWYMTQNTMNYTPTGSSFTCVRQYTEPSCY